MSFRTWSGRPAAVVAAALVLVALSAAPAAATTTVWWVGGANCSDTGPGTQQQPFCTIGKAASLVTAGQTVMVNSGTYPEKVTVATSGSPGSPVVFQAAPGATPVVTGGADGFVVSSKHDVTISGFTVTATTSYGISISSSTNVVLSGNTVTYAGHPVSGQIAAGIKVSGSSASLVTGNHTDHNSDSGIYLTSGTTNTTVSYNESSLNANQYQRNANGINVISPGNTILGNVVHDNEDSGLQFYTGGDNNLATLNVSYNNGDHGIDDFNVTGGRLIGNTIYHNCTSGINVEGTSGNYLVENNISVDNAVFRVNPTPEVGYTNTCQRRAGNIGIWDSAPATTTVDDNEVWLSVSGTMYVFGTAYTSLAAMRTATGQEQHGAQADPLFADAAGFDLRLTPASPAIDAADSGASGEQTADIAGTTRVDDTAVTDTGIGPRSYDDRGAYEYNPNGGGPLPPTASLAVTPASGTAPLQVTADASGSTDPQGQALTYTFAFGDGGTAGPQSTPTAGHTYTTPGSYTVTVTVTDTAQLTGTASGAVTVTQASGGGGSATYVSQIATNSSTSTHTSGSITVWRTTGVAAGDLEVVTLQLTGVTPGGAVSGVDDAGNTLTAASDVSDGNGDRLVVLSGVAHTALVPNNKITVTFPSATSYRMTGDEVAGVTVPDVRATASGTGSAYASGPTATTAFGHEFVFGAVALFGGSAPSWAAGWTAETTYAVGSNYLGRAYQIPAGTGSFNASGTGTGAWLATCVTFD